MNAEEPRRLNRNVDAVREAIEASFFETGQATVDVHDIRISLDEWRKVARGVARSLGRPVETVASDSRAWAVLRDWPANPREQVIHEAAMRRAMDSVRLQKLKPPE